MLHIIAYFPGFSSLLTTNRTACNATGKMKFSLGKEREKMRLTTTDLYESGFLHSQGAFLSGAWADKGNSSTVFFSFEDDSEATLSELQDSYHSGKATVNLAEYRQSLELLKDLMFQILRKNNRRSNHAHRRN